MGGRSGLLGRRLDLRNPVSLEGILRVVSGLFRHSCFHPLKGGGIKSCMERRVALTAKHLAWRSVYMSKRLKGVEEKQEKERVGIMQCAGCCTITIRTRDTYSRQAQMLAARTNYRGPEKRPVVCL